MSATALYRALVQAGSSEELAKEAADDIDADRNTTNERLTRIETFIKIMMAFVLATFFLVLKSTLE